MLYIAYFFLIGGALFLAWSNGANDNFKGVATLYGSGTVGFRRALVWTTVATLLGSSVSVILARSLTIAFSGKALLPETALGPALLGATGTAAAITIFLATVLGMPTSTTHALTGSLVGAGLAATGPAAIDWHLLATKFAQPLLLSPVLAVTITAIVYALLSSWRRRLAVADGSCVCIAENTPAPMGLPADGVAVMAPVEGRNPLEIGVGLPHECAERYPGKVLGLRARWLVDVVHYISAAAVCFARAVNDTPKIAALLLGATALTGGVPTAVPLALVALVMALGGWLQSRRVAETMWHEITDLNPGQGLTANLMTAALVLGASRLGLPVSTTHVSCGSLFGIGLVSGGGHRKTILQILATWVTTLPVALLLGFAIFTSFSIFGVTGR